MRFGGSDARTDGDLTRQSAHQAGPPTQHIHLADYRRPLPEIGATSVSGSRLRETRPVEESVDTLREHRHDSPGQP